MKAKQPQVGPDGHPIPEQQGIVGAVIQPIKFQNAGEADAVARGAALDAAGNPIDQTAELEALLAAARAEQDGQS